MVVLAISATLILSIFYCSIINNWIGHKFHNLETSSLCFQLSITVDHILSPKSAMILMGFDPGISGIVSHHSTNWGKEISTNAVSRGGYEPTMIPITLDGGAFPLYKIKLFFLKIVIHVFYFFWNVVYKHLQYTSNE